MKPTSYYKIQEIGKDSWIAHKGGMHEFTTDKRNIHLFPFTTEEDKLAHVKRVEHMTGKKVEAINW